MLNILTQCIIFKGLKNSDIETLFKKIPYQLKKFGKDDIIAIAGVEVKSLLIVLEGSVRGEMTDDTGKTIKIEDIESPNLLAPAFLFGMQNKYPVSIIANKNTTVLYIQKFNFLNLLQSNEKILTNYLDNICNRAQFLSGKIKFLSFQTIKGKLAHLFIQMANKSGRDEFMMQKSQNELSEMFGVTRPSLSRALREMDKDELIHADGKHIKILDREGLMDLLK